MTGEPSFEASKEEPPEREHPEIPQEGRSFESPEFQERVERERDEARERFGDLIDLVNQRYEDGNLSPAEKEKFKQHNGEVLDYAVELGLRKEFDEEELKAVEVAAILHDLTKAYPLPEEFVDIPNYGLVTHGQRAAEEVGEILTDERLERYNLKDRSPDEFRNEVSNAITQHMGPHPGFMTNVLEGVNRVLGERGYQEVSHPQARGTIPETLLAADMASLASADGRRKILAIHTHNDFFRLQDLQTVEKYRGADIELRQGETALLAAFTSARQAVEMITDPDDRKMLEELFEASKSEEYLFDDDPEPVRFEEAWRKKEEFEAKGEKKEGAA